MKKHTNITEESSDCDQPVALPSLETLSSIRNGLFMLETSGVRIHSNMWDKWQVSMTNLRPGQIERSPGLCSGVSSGAVWT